MCIRDRPGTEPQISEGDVTKKMILGGRFLQEDYSGMTPDGPFTGMGLTGYDNMQGKYIGMWVDTMMTSMMTSTGTCDASGKTFTFTGDYDDPLDGLRKKMRTVVTIINDKKHVEESYVTPPGGKEFKMIEVVYTRGTVAEFKVKELQVQNVLAIRATVSKEQIGAKIGELVPAVFGYVLSKGGQPSGPPFTRYHKAEGDRFEIEVGVPVVEPVAGEGRFETGTLPAGKAAVTLHIGPYEKIEKTHCALEDWMKSQGLTSAAAPWEVYWTDPNQEPDPSKLKTEIIWPVKPISVPVR